MRLHLDHRNLHYLQAPTDTYPAPLLLFKVPNQDFLVLQETLNKGTRIPVDATDVKEP